MKEIIESKEFANALDTAVRKAVEEDYYYDVEMEDEYPVTEFDPELAVEEILMVIKAYLL